MHLCRTKPRGGNYKPSTVAIDSNARAILSAQKKDNETNLN